MIGIIDISIGNPKSIQNALSYMGIESEMIYQPASIKSYTKLILPGVGNYGAYIDKLIRTGFFAGLDKYSKEEGLPILGICVGAQALLQKSAEGDGVMGLGLIPGQVSQIQATSVQKVPNVGWREIDYSQSLFHRTYLNAVEKYYFSHGYELKVNNEFMVAEIVSNNAITAIIRKENIIGVQFHPEKSNKHGLKFLKEFSEWVP
jgi:glutamine amidotransferase